MKKKFITFLLLFTCSFFLFGCAGNTPEKTAIVKIKTTCIEAGFISTEYVRTFDFTANTVHDDCVVDEDYIQSVLAGYAESEAFPTYESFEQFIRGTYNASNDIGTFTAAQSEELLKTIESLGILDWEDAYSISDEEAGGSGRSYIEIVFSDGTKRVTEFYYSYPKNYAQILFSFETCLGFGLYYQSSDSQ